MRIVFLCASLTLCILFSCDTPLQQGNAAKEYIQSKNPDSLLAPARAALANGEYELAKIKASAYAEKYADIPVGIAAKALISEADSLSAVELKARDEKAAALKNKMRKSVDDMKGITWWYAVSTPKHVDRNSFHIYIGEKDNEVWLRFRIQYYADSWLFIKRYMIKADSNLYDIIPNSTVETDNDYGKIWETYEQGVNKTEAAMLRDISKAKVVKVRFEGRQYYNDRVLSSAEKAGIAQVLDLYEAMGGEYSDL